MYRKRDSVGEENRVCYKRTSLLLMTVEVIIETFGIIFSGDETLIIIVRVGKKALPPGWGRVCVLQDEFIATSWGSDDVRMRDRDKSYWRL